MSFLDFQVPSGPSIRLILTSDDANECHCQQNYNTSTVDVVDQWRVRDGLDSPAPTSDGAHDIDETQFWSNDSGYITDGWHHFESTSATSPDSILHHVNSSMSTLDIASSSAAGDDISYLNVQRHDSAPLSASPPPKIDGGGLQRYDYSEGNIHGSHDGHSQLLNSGLSFGTCPSPNSGIRSPTPNSSALYLVPLLESSDTYPHGPTVESPTLFDHASQFSIQVAEPSTADHPPLSSEFLTGSARYLAPPPVDWQHDHYTSLTLNSEGRGRRSARSWSSNSSRRHSPYMRPRGSPSPDSPSEMNYFNIGREPSVLPADKSLNEAVFGSTGTNTQSQYLLVPSPSFYRRPNCSEESLGSPTTPSSWSSSSALSTASSSPRVGFSPNLERRLEDTLVPSVTAIRPEVGSVSMSEAGIRRRNPNKPVKLFCLIPGCGKSFTAKHNLLFHNNAHSGERSHVCLACGRAFGIPHVLKRHNKTCKGIDSKRRRSD